MQFSKIKKRIVPLLATSLDGRLNIYASVHRKFHDQPGRVWITFDKQTFFIAEDLVYSQNEHLKYEEKKSILPKRPSLFTIDIFQSDWYLQQKKLYEEIVQELSHDDMYSSYIVQNALIEYPNLTIEQAMVHNNPFIRGFAFFDRRFGKRKLQVTQQVDTQFEKACYEIRMIAEGLKMR